jgi:4-hydroxythreonine-4-phosphate dehydrogenase
MTAPAFPRVAPFPRVALVIGDPAGIGPELAAKLLATPEIRDSARILVIGDRRVLAAGERVAGVAANVMVVDQPTDAQPGTPLFWDLRNCDPATVPMGEATVASGASVMANFRAGLELGRTGAIDVLYFTPFNKQAMRLAGNPYLDELHFAADVLDHKGACSEFNILGRIWNARVTSHIPFKDVIQHITVDNICAALRLTNGAMRKAGYGAPRIALAALNPHAGDGGNFGTEETEILEPAVARARGEGIDVSGPYPSDTVFLRARDGHFDCVQTLFHDQGQIAVKALGFDQGVTVLGGLPVSLCTPAHGTAYEIAGLGKANPGAALAAFRIACAVGRSNARAT